MEGVRRRWIDQLVLSAENVGKLGGWNCVFSMAGGRYVAYTDSDVYFHPGWFEALREVLDEFPQAGYVTGCGAPFSFRGANLEATLCVASADPRITVERGQLVPDPQLWDYAESMGYDPLQFSLLCRSDEQCRVSRGHVRAFAATSHWHFLTRSEILREVLPFQPQYPLGSDSDQWQEKFRSRNSMQLAACEPVVYHLGNVLTARWKDEGHRLAWTFQDASNGPRSNPLRMVTGQYNEDNATLPSSDE
jgi:glycosyltransferase involved in cell wall biosynthesis